MHSRTSLSPVGESSAGQEESPGTWGDAVERKEVVWRIPCWWPALQEDKTGCFRRDEPACEPSAFAKASAQFVQCQPLGGALQGSSGSCRELPRDSGEQMA